MEYLWSRFLPYHFLFSSRSHFTRPHFFAGTTFERRRWSILHWSANVTIVGRWAMERCSRFLRRPSLPPNSHIHATWLHLTRSQWEIRRSAPSPHECRRYSLVSCCRCSHYVLAHSTCAAAMQTSIDCSTWRRDLQFLSRLGHASSAQSCIDGAQCRRSCRWDVRIL